MNEIRDVLVFAAAALITAADPYSVNDPVVRAETVTSARRLYIASITDPTERAELRAVWPELFAPEEPELSPTERSELVL